MTDQRPGDLEARVRYAYQSAARTVQTLQRPSPMLADGSVPRRRRMNAFVPLAAAVAVIVAIGAGVALPRLLSGASRLPDTPGISGPPSGLYPPPFRVLVTATDGNRDPKLLVESAATGHVVSQLAPPWRGAMWMDAAATADATRFIVAAETLSWPYTPSRLYSLTLSARGTVTRLAPLPVPAMPGELTSLAASADGSTVAYTMLGPGGTYEVGVITGGRTRQWSVPAGLIAGISHVSLSGDGGTLAVITSSGGGRKGFEDTAWVLPTGSAPGSLTASARKVYEHNRGPGPAMTLLESALISQDGRTLYLSTAAVSPSRNTVSAVTAYSTAHGARLGAISTWEGDSQQLSPVGGMLLIWAMDTSTAQMINPATRTRTTLRLPGFPLARGQYLRLAW